MDVLFAGTIVLVVGHPLFKIRYQLAQGEGDAQIQDTYNDQALKCLVGGTFDDIILGHQVANIEGGGQGGFLQDHDKFVTQGRQNVPDGCFVFQ